MISNRTSVVAPSSKAFLQRLYFTRVAVQIIWAAAIWFAAAKALEYAVILTTLYPLWDVASTVWDLRSNPQSSSRLLLLTNAALGVAAAVAIAVFGNMQPRYTVMTFGVWALIAGVLQLVIGLVRRRTLKGQSAIILSGAQSTFVGAAFFVGGIKEKVHLRDLAGYALFGALYFFIAGLLLLRKNDGTADAFRV